MNRRQKIIATTLWVLLLTTTLVLLAVWSRHRLLPALARATAVENRTTALFEVPAFTFTDQENRTIDRDALKGRPWVAAFIFTRCPGPCPVITKRMSELQAKLPPEVKLVSFSLDPAHDTPPILKDYAAKYAAAPTRWHFLTGEADQVRFIANELKIGATRAENPIEMSHGTHLTLVNPDGWVHDYYANDDADATRRLIDDATALVAEE